MMESRTRTTIPLTPSPTNQSTFRQWRVRLVFYSALIMAEAMGLHNASQIVDLSSNINTPIYAIYENGAPTKVALFNFVTDPTRASTYTATISIGGGSTGQNNETTSQSATESVSSQSDFTWADQMFGNDFEASGRLSGMLTVTIISYFATHKYIQYTYISLAMSPPPCLIPKISTLQRLFRLLYPKKVSQ
jgi:hypothetical protein